MSHLTSTCPSAYASASDGSVRAAPRTAAAAIAVARACDTRERGPTATTQQGRQARIDPRENAGAGVRAAAAAAARRRRNAPTDPTRRAFTGCALRLLRLRLCLGKGGVGGCAGARQRSASALSDG